MAKEISNSGIMIADSRRIEDKVYIVRGVQVMLDFELAEIYGYTTGKLNERVKDNKERFLGEEFMFRLSKEEYQNLISKNRISSWGGTRHMPYAFTEQGIYMLMTVLKGDLAVSQSRKLVKMFKRMKEYITRSEPILNTSIKLLAIQTEENTKAIKRMESNMVTHDDLTDFMKLFDSGIKNEEVLIMDGKPFKADLAYQKIYKKAKKNIFVIDDYISIKTLTHLTVVNPRIKITIITDNKGKALRLSEYEDFMAEYPEINITFLKSNGRIHDRYIVLDYDNKESKVYHSGASIKDAGKRITSITELKDKELYKQLVKELLNNPELILR